MLLPPPLLPAAVVLESIVSRVYTASRGEHCSRHICGLIHTKFNLARRKASDIESADDAAGRVNKKGSRIEGFIVAWVGAWKVCQGRPLSQDAVMTDSNRLSVTGHGVEGRHQDHSSSSMG